VLAGQRPLRFPVAEQHQPMAQDAHLDDSA
jgi:hypothetical protein